MQECGGFNDLFDSVDDGALAEPVGGAAAAGNRYGGPRDAASSPGIRRTDQRDCPAFPSCL